MKDLIESSYGTMYYVKDMIKEKEFFKNAIGLSPRFESEEWVEFGLKDGTAICLHAEKPGQRYVPGGVLIVNVKNLKDKVEKLKNEGVEFFQEVHEVHPGAFSTDFKDPSGNLISLYENTNEYDH